MKATWAFLRVIDASLRYRPTEWSANKFTIDNAEKHISIWIANSAYGIELRVDGAELKLPLFSKRFIRKAVDTCLAQQAINRFRKAA